MGTEKWMASRRGNSFRGDRREAYINSEINLVQLRLTVKNLIQIALHSYFPYFQGPSLDTGKKLLSLYRKRPPHPPNQNRFSLSL